MSNIEYTIGTIRRRYLNISIELLCWLLCSLERITSTGGYSSQGCTLGVYINYKWARARETEREEKYYIYERLQVCSFIGHVCCEWSLYSPDGARI